MSHLYITNDQISYGLQSSRDKSLKTVCSSCAEAQYHENSSRSRSFHGIVDGDRERMQLFGTKINSQPPTSPPTINARWTAQPLVLGPLVSRLVLLTMTTTTTIGTMCIASMLLTKLSSAKGNEKTKKERKRPRTDTGGLRTLQCGSRWDSFSYEENSQKLITLSARLYVSRHGRLRSLRRLHCNAFRIFQVTDQITITINTLCIQH
ncbi:hypothetical protein ALC57_10368 [Trachymyrmex cornetzi]|uniref:Uncharacterized protein n=1 Tax=Trachymyrmex cornetzi TaxID=471704 RepID=A0A195DXF0_9HYME|nr:hypothetical protein ALC57_10368 [Trachymyrmex cornetzi]